MKTNQNALKKYLVDLINFDGYDNVIANTPAEKVSAAMKICREEVGYIETKEGTQAMVEYWFSGLCSVVPLPYSDNDIIETARQFCEFGDSEEEKLIVNWFAYMSAKFCQLARKYSNQ